MARRFGNAGRKMTMAFTVPFAAAAGGAIKAAADFQKSMALVEVAAQRAGEDTTQLRKDLRGLALEMSKKTIFTVEQTSDAMLELARAGVVTAEEMREALPPALDLAAAGELEVEEATRGLVNVLKQFELGMDQATRAADALAKGAVISTADVNDMIQAFSHVGPLAREMGLSIEDTSVAISILSDRGLQGGRAGRGLRQIMKSLIDPSKEAAETLSDLGVSIADEGEIKPFKDILEELRVAIFEQSTATRTLGSRHAVSAKQLEKARKVTADYATDLQKLTLRLVAAEGRGGRVAAKYGEQSTQLAGAQASIIQARQNLGKLNDKYNAAQRVIAQATGALERQVTVTRELTPQQQKATLATLFTSRALGAAIPLIRAGREGWDKYVKEMERAATAQEQARKVTDTLLGAMQRLRNIITVLAIETILPFVEDTLTPLINRLNEWLSIIEALDPKITRFALTVGGIAAAVGPTILGMSQLIRIWGLLASPLGIVTLGLSVIGGLMVANKDQVKDWGFEVDKTGKKWTQFKEAKKAFHAMLRGGGPLYVAVATALREFGPAGKEASKAVFGLAFNWKEFVNAITSGRPEDASENLERMFTLIEELIGPHIDKLKAKIIEKSGTMWADVGKWWSEEGGKELTKGFVGILDTLIAGFIRLVLHPFAQFVFRAGTGLINAFLEGVLTGDMEGSFRRLFQELGDVFELPKTQKALENWKRDSDREWDELMPDVKTRIQAVWKKTLLKTFGTFDYAKIVEIISVGIYEAMMEEFFGVGKWFAEMFIANLEADTEALQWIGDKFFAWGKAWAKRVIQGMLEGLSIMKQRMAEKLHPSLPSSGFGPGPPPPIPAGVVPGAQHGGTFLAARPTLLAVGEGGSEIVSVSPVQGLGQQGGGPSLTLQIGTLIGDTRSIDILVSRVEDVLARQQRYGMVRLS